MEKAREAAKRADASSQRAKAPGATAEADTEADGEPTPKAFADEGYETSADEAPSPKLPTDKDVQAMDPVVRLKKIGIELTDDDAWKLVSHGTITKDVQILKKPDVRATLRTLTFEEYRVVDELLAEDMEQAKMTNAGAVNRRSLWILTLGVTHLQRKPLRDLKAEGAIDGDGNVDLKKAARLHKETLEKMWPALVAHLSFVHGEFQKALVDMLSDKGSSGFFEIA